MFDFTNSVTSFTLYRRIIEHRLFSELLHSNPLSFLSPFRSDLALRHTTSLNEQAFLGAKKHICFSTTAAADSLALPVLQIEMWIEVDEDPLVRTRRGYHPCASLRGGIRHGVLGRGEVVGG